MVAKKSFQDIFTLFQQQDLLLGWCTFNKFEPTLRNISARIFLITGILIQIWVDYSEYFGDDLLVGIMQFCATIVYLFVGSIFPMMKMKPDETAQIFDFCKEMYEYERRFPVKLHVIIRKHLDLAYDRTKLLCKWAVIILYLDGAVTTFGITIIGHFLPDSIYPKYRLPFPFKFKGFKVHDTPSVYYFSVFAQSLLGMQTTMHCALLVSILFGVCIHVLAYLDIVIDIIKMMGREIKDHVLNSKLRKRQVVASTSRVQNVSSSDDPSLDLEPWIKIFVDMVENVGRVMSSVDALFSVSELLSECAAFGSFIEFGLTFLVLKKQQSLGIAVLPMCMTFFAICSINERIQTKLSEISFSLYDIEWYNLSAKEVKFLLVAMNANNIGIGFNAMGYHDLTLDRFADVAKAAYTNCLVLKDIITK